MSEKEEALVRRVLREVADALGKRDACPTRAEIYRDLHRRASSLSPEREAGIDHVNAAAERAFEDQPAPEGAGEPPKSLERRFAETAHEFFNLPLPQDSAPPASLSTAGLEREQDAFEAWAAGAGYVMDQHPIHYLFLDTHTADARGGWKAALAWVDRRSSPPAVAGESDEDDRPSLFCPPCFCVLDSAGEVKWRAPECPFHPSVPPAPTAEDAELLEYRRVRETIAALREPDVIDRAQRLEAANQLEKLAHYRQASNRRLSRPTGDAGKAVEEWRKAVDSPNGFYTFSADRVAAMAVAGDTLAKALQEAERERRHFSDEAADLTFHYAKQVDRAEAAEQRAGKMEAVAWTAIRGLIDGLYSADLISEVGYHQFLASLPTQERG